MYTFCSVFLKYVIVHKHSDVVVFDGSVYVY